MTELSYTLGEDFMNSETFTVVVTANGKTFDLTDVIVE